MLTIYYPPSMTIDKVLEQLIAGDDLPFDCLFCVKLVAHPGLTEKIIISQTDESASDRPLELSDAFAALRPPVDDYRVMLRELAGFNYTGEVSSE